MLSRISINIAFFTTTHAHLQDELCGSQDVGDTAALHLAKTPTNLLQEVCHVLEICYLVHFDQLQATIRRSKRIVGMGRNRANDIGDTNKLSKEHTKSINGADRRSRGHMQRSVHSHSDRKGKKNVVWT